MLKDLYLNIEDNKLTIDSLPMSFKDRLKNLLFFWKPIKVICIINGNIIYPNGEEDE